MSGRGRAQAVSTQLRAQQAYRVCPTRSQPQPKTQQEHRRPEKGLCEVCRNLCTWPSGGQYIVIFCFWNVQATWQGS